MRCGFSMAQIGEFAFIIASLGLSLGVISEFLYPVVVAVSVITTFLTPYMIRAAEPAYTILEKRLPKRWIRRLNHLGAEHHASPDEQSLWKRLLRKMMLNTLIYAILILAITAVMLSFFLPFARHLLPHWWANGVCGVLTLLLIAPFMRALVMKNNHSDEFRALWIENRMNRLPLTFTVLARIAIAVAFLFYICNYLARFANAVVITLALTAIALMILSRGLKQRSIRLERLFIKNLNSREIQAEVTGKRKPRFEGHLLDRDIHISEFTVPENSSWAGQSLGQIEFRNRFGVHVSSILRGYQRLNIPGGDCIIFPGDQLQVIGNDEQLTQFGRTLDFETIPEDEHIEEREMKLQKFVISSKSKLIGTDLQNSGIRDQYNCMVVGIEEGQQHLTIINPSHVFQAGDIVWMVGERESLAAVTTII